MAKQMEGVYERIMECARQEFLKNGYTDASLRKIAAGADTCTNSIYVRFKDKEGLFTAIVEPALNGMTEMFMDILERFQDFDGEAQQDQIRKHSMGGVNSILDYMYDHLDAFRLLLDASYGTRFHHFVDGLVQMEVENISSRMKTAGYAGGIKGTVAEDLLHIVTTSYFEGLFEVIRHGMSREDAKKYARILGKYHHMGFTAIFHPVSQ